MCNWKINSERILAIPARKLCASDVLYNRQRYFPNNKNACVITLGPIVDQEVGPEASICDGSGVRICVCLSLFAFLGCLLRGGANLDGFEKL